MTRHHLKQKKLSAYLELTIPMEATEGRTHYFSSRAVAVCMPHWREHFTSGTCGKIPGLNGGSGRCRVKQIYFRPKKLSACLYERKFFSQIKGNENMERTIPCYISAVVRGRLSQFADRQRVTRHGLTLDSTLYSTSNSTQNSTFNLFVAH